MGDRMRTSQPSRYVSKTNVNSAFHPSGCVNRVGRRQGLPIIYNFARVGCQVTLCDPTWQVTLRRSVMGYREQLYTCYTPFTSVSINQSLRQHQISAA